MRDNVVRFIDLFGGVGGFRLGLERASVRLPNLRRDSYDNQGGTSRLEIGHNPNGFKCVWYGEIDKYAVSVYNKNFKEDHQPTDIRGVDAESIPDFDLLCAGFPCQSFSIAGKRRGFDDTRGTLFFEIARIAKVKRPRLLLLENVKGLLSHDDGRTFRTILATLDELGYDAEWEVLNSKHFGVPQNRERVFIVGHLRGEPRREVFPIGQSGQTPPELSGLEVGAVTARRGTAQSDGDYLVEGFGQTQDGQSHAIDANYHKESHHGERTIVVYDDFNDRITKDVGAVRPTFNNEAGGNGVKIVLGNLYKSQGENGQVIDPEGISGTLKSGETDNPDSGGIGSSNSPKLFLRQRIRRLTPIECERLQGFPDGWTSGVSDTQRYKMMGNAVTVNVIQAIGECLA